MLPPWLKFPKIPAGSIGWRMGDGEDYWLEWLDWFLGQDEGTRTTFTSRFAEPLGWEGFYISMCRRNVSA